MSDLAEALRDAIAARRAAIDSGDDIAMQRARGEHLRVVGEILASRADAKPTGGKRGRS